MNTLFLTLLLAGNPALPPAPYDRDYAEFYAKVEAGSPGFLHVGVDVSPTYDDCWLPSGSFGYPDGSYYCRREGGRMVVYDPPTAAAVEVAAARPKPSGPAFPTTPATGAPSAGTRALPVREPGSSAAGTRTAPTATRVPVVALPGSTSGCRT